MSSSNSKLLKFFVHTPKLEIDGSNWVIFKDCFLFAATAAAMKGHVDGMDIVLAPVGFSHQPGEPLKEDQQEALKEYQLKCTKWEMEENIVKQVLVSIIPDSFFIEVRRKETAALMWDAVKDQREKKSQMVIVDIVERVTLYVVDNTRILGNAIVVKHSL